MTDNVALFKEPLLQFALIGTLIFALYALVAPPPQAPANVIAIEAAQIEQLIANYQKTWRQEPDQKAVAAMIEDAVREEIYYREALALGLDRNDKVIRLRLRQKMEFLSDTGADLLDPEEAELSAYFAANQENYRQPAKLALEQIFLGASADAAEIQTIVETLTSNPATDPLRWQQASLLPAQLPLSSHQAIDGIFGQGFFAAIAALPPNQWSAPVPSSFGVHLVRIREHQQEQTPPLDDIRALVARDWKAQKTLELRNQLFAKLREQYQIQLPAPFSRLLSQHSCPPAC